MARSSSELIEKLAKASRPIKAAILLGVAALLGGLYYYFFYSDLSQQKDDLAAKRKGLEADVKQLTDQLTKYNQLLKDKKEAESKRADINDKAPRTAEIPAFYQHLETQASTANVKLLNRNLGKESTFDIFTRIPVDMEVEGTFYEINHYFQLLGDPKTTKRVITIENLAMATKEKDGDNLELKAKFTAVGFRQSNGQEEAAPAAPAGAPASSAAPGAPVASSSATPPPVAPVAPTAPATSSVKAGVNK